MKTSFLRAQLHMAYPTTMETLAALPPDIWTRTPPEAQAYIRVLEVRVAALESEMQALHAQLQQTSQHSSRPPSSDPPQHQRRRRPRSKRRRGGQPGHPGHTRTLLPVGPGDRVVVLQPPACSTCSPLLSGADPN